MQNSFASIPQGDPGDEVDGAVSGEFPQNSLGASVSGVAMVRGVAPPSEHG